MPEWARVCATIAGSAGRLHDLGKYGVIFQEKLKSARPKADEVRHEWISLMLVRELIKGASWKEAWENIGEGGKAKRYRNIDPFDGKLSNARDVLLYTIATHHRLPKADGKMIGTGNHVRSSEHKPETKHAPNQATMDKILRALEKVKACKGKGDHLYWRAVAMISRVALILADHSVSAKKEMHEDGDAYANTDRKTKRPNQKLEWHLDEVGKTASEMVFNILALAPPVLSRDTVERICEPSSGIYSWQNDSARALNASVEQSKMPHLVLNIAGTGSGKTRMNSRAICVLNQMEEVRFATALNLRTLTLQTGDVYANQFGIGKDELTCVIGDRLTSRLHEHQKSSTEDKEAFADDDENPVVEEFESVGEFEYHEKPDWLTQFTYRKPKLNAIIGSPILVSTIDFLIAGGEPHMQVNHALAMLRVMTSDLILDEIDGYDPKPLLSVLRLVMTSAMFGKNVVASSATLSRPVARLLWQAYATGAKMRERLTGEGFFNTAIIDDNIAPQVGKHETVEEFTDAYEGHLTALQNKLAGVKTRRVPTLQKLETKNRYGWNSALRNAVKKLHDNQAWVDPETGKRLSIGLVRMANIRPAVETAIYLAEEFPQARVACYHSNHFTIQRWYIEKRLDELLTRKNGDEHILKDKEIRNMLDTSEFSDLMLIVVATPVEEIGRDHDFDWAVIEPSSAQSIVQTAGRVNRHRLVNISKPNIAIMQYNLREVEKVNDETLVFRWPGFEVLSQYKYKSHDLSKLLDWDSMKQIDARLRFGDHLFTKLDDKSIDDVTKGIFTRMTSCDKSKNLWMALETYTKSRLRDNDGMIRIELTLNKPYKDKNSFQSREQYSKDEPGQRRVDDDGNKATSWLSKADAELVELAKEMLDDEEIDSALTVTVTANSASGVSRHMSFGFYRKTKA